MTKQILKVLEKECVVKERVCRYCGCCSCPRRVHGMQSTQNIYVSGLEFYRCPEKGTVR